MSSQRSLRSLRYIHAKINGDRLGLGAFSEIVADINFGRYDDVHIAAFLTACAANSLDIDEINHLTKAMVRSGHTLDWKKSIVVDKHCVGGLPGNRTSPIIVSIVAAAGLTIPKTSSRAITSAAGTADTMEVLAPVDLSIAEMKRVVDQEGGCIVWGGNVGLSPVDDDLVRIARALEFDGEEQLVASVLSKKIAAGATHAVIDIPVGPSAKIQDDKEAQKLKSVLLAAAEKWDLSLIINLTDGGQPVGRGIGPALEARDVVAVLENQASAPADLKERALSLAGALLEIGRVAEMGGGHALAGDILQSGRAWHKFEAICEAQGGLREIPVAKHTYPLLAQKSGTVSAMDNQLISKLAKTAGAPEDKPAGLDLHVQLNDPVFRDQPILTIHAQSKQNVNAVLEMVETESPAITVMDIEEKIRSY